jgi:hypothetical protein
MSNRKISGTNAGPNWRAGRIDTIGVGISAVELLSRFSSQERGDGKVESAELACDWILRISDDLDGPSGTRDRQLGAASGIAALVGVVVIPLGIPERRDVGATLVD